MTVYKNKESEKCEEKQKTESESGWGEPSKQEQKKEETEKSGWGEPSKQEQKKEETESESGWGEPSKQEQKKEETEKSGWGEPNKHETEKESEYKKNNEKITNNNYANGSDNNSWSKSNTYTDRSFRQNERGADSFKSEQGSYRSDMRERRGDWQQKQESYGGRERRNDSFGGGQQRYNDYHRNRYDEQRSTFDGERRSLQYTRNEQYTRDEGRMRKDSQPRDFNRREGGIQRKNYNDNDYEAKRRNYGQFDDKEAQTYRERQYSSRYGDDERARTYNNREFQHKNDRDFSGMQNRRDYSARPKREIPANPPPSHVLGLFGISNNANEEDIKDYVAEHVPNIQYEKMHLIRDRITGDSRGFAFIYFESVEEAISAKECLIGKTMQGREIRVDFSISSKPRNETG